MRRNFVSRGVPTLVRMASGSPSSEHQSRKGKKNNNNTTSTKLRDPVRQVFISQSTDIFTNLALEDWIYQNHDFDHKSLLLLWRNDPCVVIGRHQNPWVESNVPYLRESYTKLARRNSGGGTVYHDLGNLNCTFFTRRSAYDRRRNLEVVCAAIKAVADLDVRVNDRDDIVFNSNQEDKKVSGTAAKLSRNAAYHHCTVLVDVNECRLHDAISSKAEGVESRATQSVRVPVKNLSALCGPSKQIDVASLQESLGWAFLRTDVDGHMVDDEALACQRGFQLVRPEEVWFPGLDKLREEFESTQWIFGKTPKFKVCRLFGVPRSVFNPDHVRSGSDAVVVGEFNIELEVTKGKVEAVTTSTSGGFSPEEIQALVDAIQSLEFGPGLAHQLQDRLHSVSTMSTNKKQFFVDCVYTMTHKFA